jgi:hypothetical protein
LYFLEIDENDTVGAKEKMNPINFGNTENGYKTNSTGESILNRRGFGLGLFYNYSGTKIIKIK